MFTSRKIKYTLVTSLGNITFKNSEIKNKNILKFFDMYSHNLAYWLYAYRTKEQKSSDKTGKWMLFIKDENLSDCWDKLVLGIDNGVFNTIKCSIPNFYNPHYTPGINAIMVYTDDYEDLENIKYVLKFLLDNNLDYGNELFYKADYQTSAGKYEGGRGESWLYSSNDFKF